MNDFPLSIQAAIHYLQEQITQNGVIVLFGSRVTRPFKKYADFDIGLFMRKPLSWRTFSLWKTRVEELAWPYRIDLVDLARAPSEFLEVVRRHMCVLHGEWDNDDGFTRKT